MDPQFIGQQVEELHRLVDQLCQENPEEITGAQPLIEAIANQLVRIKALQTAKDPATGARAPITALTDLTKFPEENPNPILRLDLQGVILYANTASRQVLQEWGCQVGQTAPGAWIQRIQQAAASGEKPALDIQVGNQWFTFLIVPLREAGYVNLYGRDITERKHIEAERERLLRENRRQAALLDGIFEADPSGLAVVTNPELRLVYANPAYRFICPHNGDDLIGQPYEKIWSAVDPNCYSGPIREVIETGRPFQTQGFERHFPDGARRIFTLQARRIEWDDQPAVLLALWDTTELKQTEEHLAFQADLLDNVHDAILALDPQLRITFWNQAAEELYGWSKAEAMGQVSSHLLQSEISEAQRKQALNQTDQTGLYEGEVIHHTRDGRRLVVEPHFKSQKDASGQVIGYIAANRDITERKLAEEKLHFQASLLENIHDAVFATDLALTITAWNKAAEQLYGWKAEEAVGKTANLLLRSEISPEESQSIVYQLEQTGLSVGEAVHHARNGRRIIVESYTVLQRGPDGQPTGFTSSNRDITEHKQAEQALRESEQCVKARVAELETLMDAAPVMIWISRDRECREMTGNRYGFEFLDMWQSANLSKTASENALQQQTYRNFKDGREVPAQELPMQIAAATGQPTDNYEFDLVFGEGVTRTVLGNVRPLLDDAGQPAGAMGVFMDITERKRGEERLRESREQNEFLANVIILSSQPFGVGYLDGRLGLVNQAFEQLTGYTSEELHAIDWAKTLTPPEWVELEQQKLNELLETGQPVRYEKEYQRKDGTCVPIELLVHLVRDAAGNPQSYYSFITDITARKQAEKALRESEERFRILADSNPLIIWVTNAEGGVRFVNRTYREYFGVTLEQVEGKNWQPLLHPEDAPAYLEAFQTALREKKPFSAESRVRRADGVWRWLASYAEPRFSPEGEFLGFIGNSPDVTERKRYEDEIRASQARLLLTTEAAGVGVWSVNLPSMQVYCDDQVRQMLNLPDQAPLEIRFFERRIHPEDWARVEQIARQMLAAPQRLEVEFRVRPLEGDERWLSMRGQGQFDSQGQVSQLVGVMMDITEAKRIQEEIRSGLDRIEVQRRLLEQREQERLKIARDLHDGPVQELTGAHYALEGIIYTTEDEALGQGLQSIREVIKTQVAELRAFAGELRPPTLAKFGLGKALLSYAEEFQEKHPELKIQVEATQEGELLPQAVRLGLFRIFQESLQNIHKHAQATAVNVRLTKNSEIAALEIRDNGMGFDVPTDWLDLARQGHLGLVGMRERAEALGGQAVIISSPGQGTQVQVRVPFASATVPES